MFHSFIACSYPVPTCRASVISLHFDHKYISVSSVQEVLPWYYHNMNIISQYSITTSTLSLNVIHEYRSVYHQYNQFSIATAWTIPPVQHQHIHHFPNFDHRYIHIISKICLTLASHLSRWTMPPVQCSSISTFTIPWIVIHESSKYVSVSSVQSVLPRRWLPLHEQYHHIIKFPKF